MSDKLRTGFAAAAFGGDGFSPRTATHGKEIGTLWVGLVGVTQRLAEVNTRFRGNTEAAYIFPIGNDARDAQAALSLVGPAYRERLFALRPHSYLRVAHGEVTEGRNRL